MSPFLGTRGAGSNRAFGYAGAAAPAQVTGLSATDFGTSRAYNNGRIDLSWSTPANNGATISGYKIERSTDNSTYSTLVANTGSATTTYSDTGLSSAQVYYYKVSAINAAGTGLASTAANATSTTVPQAPSVTAANVGTGRAFNNGAATITATGGATGGKAISSYTATSSPSSFTASGSSPVTVTGLASATAYTFSVTATNANGTSTATTSNSITATTVPQAPTIGTATAGVQSATVTYTANATGGAAVSTFTATSTPSSITGTGASPITVSGLTAGTAYTFTVTATNANGTSAASAASNSVTALVPTSYESIATFTGSGQTSVTFSSIPQTYDSLQLRINAVGSSGGTQYTVRPNNNSSNIYRTHVIEGNGSTIVASNPFGLFDRIFIQRIQVMGKLDNGVGAAIVDVHDYASTSKTKTFRYTSGSDANNQTTGYAVLGSGLFDNTGAISSLVISTSNGSSFEPGCSIALYGIKGA